MGSGIRAEVRVDPEGTCAVASATAVTETACHSIVRSVNPDDPTRMTVEFMLDRDLDDDDLGALDADVSSVFDYGAATVYRYHRTFGTDCPCDVVEAFDCPVVDRYVRDGSVFLTFHAPDIEVLQGLMGRLRDSFPGLDVRRLLRSRGEGDDHDIVFVDRSVLTDRQREALTLAHEMGYFEHPKRANAEVVAGAMGVSRPTFSEHLAAAQSKLLDAVLEA